MDSRDWEANLVQTATGIVGPEIEPLEGAGMTVQLAEQSEADFGLKLDNLPQMPPGAWLEDWWTSILFRFQGRPIYMGPMVSNPKEYYNKITYDSVGIRGLLENRIAIPEEKMNSKNIAEQTTFFGGLSLGSIGQEVVKIGMDKPGGTLPIRFGSPYESAINDANHQRTYRGYNAGTLNVDEVLTKLSNVSKGPDITFRPRMVNDAQAVWVMVHGTENNLRIAQEVVPEFDLTAQKNQAADLEITKTSTHMVNRGIAVGEGTNEATAMAKYENFTRLQKGYPLLEKVYTGIGTENKSVLRRHAQTRVLQNSKPLKEFTFFVDAYGDYPLGTYWPGDLIKVWSGGEYLNLPKGEHEMRLLTMQTEFGTSRVRLSMQLDDQWQINDELDNNG